MKSWREPRGLAQRPARCWMDTGWETGMRVKEDRIGEERNWHGGEKPGDLEERVRVGDGDGEETEKKERRETRNGRTRANICTQGKFPHRGIYSFYSNNRKPAFKNENLYKVWRQRPLLTRTN